MDREKILRRVMSLADMADMEQAEKATRAVLLALADTLSPDEAHDMASQLPKEFKDLVMGRLGEPGHTRQKMGWEDLINRLQSELGFETPEAAKRVVRSVFAALKDAVSPGEMEDVVAELPADLRETMRSA